MRNVLCAGILVADVVGRVIDSLPVRGTLDRVEKMELHVGGCAANTSIGLARLGVPVAICGRVADDGFGRFLLDALQAEGVDISGVRFSDVEPTSATMVTVHTDGERSFMHCSGANAEFSAADVSLEDAAPETLLHVAGAFLMPGMDGAGCAELLQRGKAMGLTTSLDTAWDATGRWLDLIGPSLQHTDYFLPDHAEAELISGLEDPEKAAEFFLRAGVGVVAIKLGSDGSLLASSSGERYRIPAFRVEAVDGTGAGDAYSAGFVAGLARGMSLRECGMLGSAAGACCVQALGGTRGLRDFATTSALGGLK